MKTILVTGGAGFIGSNLVQRLCALGTHRVVVCDGLGHGDKWRNLLASAIDEIVSPPNLFYWLEAQPEGSVEAVVHFGSLSSTTETDAGLLVESNLHLSGLVWRWCATHDARMIYASSFGVYGQGEAGWADGEDLDAMARLRPTHAQGWSKLLFDRFAARESHLGRRPRQWAGLRFFSVYGPNETHKGEQRSVVHKALPNVAGGHAVKLFRPGRAEYAAPGRLTRDFTHVRDCVNVVLWLLDHPEIHGIFNVGSGTPDRFETMVEALGAALGKPPHVKYIEMPAEIERGYQYRVQTDLTRLRRSGYDAPFLTVQEGVKQYVQQQLAAEEPALSGMKS